MVEELNLGLPRTNPDSSRVEDLNQGPPDFKSSALNHSAMLPHIGFVHLEKLSLLLSSSLFVIHANLLHPCFFKVPMK